MRSLVNIPSDFLYYCVIFLYYCVIFLYYCVIILCYCAIYLDYENSNAIMVQQGLL